MSFFARTADGREVDAFSLKKREAARDSAAGLFQCTHCFNRMAYVAPHLRNGQSGVRAFFRAATSHDNTCLLKNEAQQDDRQRAQLLTALENRLPVLLNLNIPTGYVERHFKLTPAFALQGTSLDQFRHKNPMAALIAIPSVHDLVSIGERIQNWHIQRGKIANALPIFVNCANVVQRLEDFIIDTPEKLAELAKNLRDTHGANCAPPRLIVFTPARSSLEDATGTFKDKGTDLDRMERLFVRLRHKVPQRFDERFLEPVSMDTATIDTKRVAIVGFPVLWGESKGLWVTPDTGAKIRFLDVNVFDRRQMAAIAYPEALEPLCALAKPKADFFSLLIGGETSSRNLAVSPSKPARKRARGQRFG